MGPTHYILRMETNRRFFLKTAGALALAGSQVPLLAREDKGILVNDVHSALNPTRVR